jgi:hypothetical protein
MRKKTFERMQKKVHELNENPLSIPIKILKMLPDAMQPNYNPKLREWFGPKEYETVVETTGIVDAFKESEDWKEVGMLGLHDYKATINDNLNLNFHDITLYMAQLDNDENKMYNIVFYREFIGEVHIGLRPLVS